MFVQRIFGFKVIKRAKKIVFKRKTENQKNNCTSCKFQTERKSEVKRIINHGFKVIINRV